MRKNVMMMMSLLCLFGGPLMAQLSLAQTSVWYEIDFEQSVSGVNNGAIAVAAGLPLLAGPAAAGQLDAAAWEIVADGANASSPAVFGNSVTAGFSSLPAPGAASYGWGAWNLGNMHALALLPSTGFGTPGSITLKIRNNTGFSLNTLAVSYRIGAYNDKDRANSVAFLYTADNITFTAAPQLTWVSGATATQSWDSTTQSLSIGQLNWQDGDYFYLRWVFQDVSGTGLRDEFLLDDIRLMASSANANSPSQLSFGEINAGIPPSAGEDFSLLVTVTDSNGNAAAVQSPLVVTLSKYAGAGQLSGVLADTLPPGMHTLNFSHVMISQAGTGLRLKAEASGLSPDTTSAFVVLQKAVYLAFTNFTDTVDVGEIIPEFSVEARRPDHSPDLNYHGQISLQKFSGPGSLQGSLSHTCASGMVSFDDVFLDQPGHYMLRAVGDSLAAVLIGVLVVVPLPAMEEVIVPRYFGAKSATAANNCRTPIAVCLRFTQQLPLTTYKLQAGLAVSGEAVSSYGAGNIWNGTGFSTSAIALNDYFMTNSSGDSGPVWLFLQPTGNSARFDAGIPHQLRLSICPNGSSMPSQPMFIGNSVLTALDISVTPRTADSLDDGSFLSGTTDESLGGKFILLYDNPAGNGQPVFCTQIRASTFTNTAQSELPDAIDSVWRQLPAGLSGRFAAVFPSGGNTGIRRLEIRNAGNVILASQQDEDGLWPQGANTANAARREVLYLTEEEIPLVNVIRGTLTYYNAGQSPLDSCLIQLSDSTGSIVQYSLTDESGRYRFSAIPNGTYTITVNCSKKWGGGNAIDAQAILHHFVKINPLGGLFLEAAQVSQPAGSVVNSVDALFVVRRFTGQIMTFPAGDWIFEQAEVSVDGSGILNIDLRGLCRGDVNGDKNPNSGY